MSLWTLKNPPVFQPDAVATEAGWAHPTTGELLVAIPNLLVKNQDAVILPTFGTLTVPMDGTYTEGQDLVFTLTASEDVQVQGTPWIDVTIGMDVKKALYVAEDSTPTLLTFKYVVVAGDVDADGIEVASVISLGENGRGKNKVSDAISGSTGENVPQADLTFIVPVTTGILVSA